MHELLDFEDLPQEIRQYVENYTIHVLDVCHTSDEHLQEFPADIRFMLLFIKYQKDREKLSDLRTLAGQELISEDTYDTIAEYSNEPGLWEWKDEVRKEGGLNMCQAIREMVAEGEKHGEDLFAKLTGKLLEDSRLEDLKEAIENAEVRRKLYQEYGISA